jgi:hypothetical protein
MTENNLIEFIIEKLKNYPDIEYQAKSSKELKIFKSNENGFDILLHLNTKENILHFGSSHWHFGKTDEELDELLKYLLFVLTGMARIKEYSKNKKGYKWILEFQDRAGNWYDNGAMGTINIKFWTKTEINYFQNNHLPKEILIAYFKE